MAKFLAFGEIMLRLSPPGRELLLQTPRLDVWVAGAEANVATQLARLGHDVGFASRVPDNDLGRAAIATLRGHGVDVRHIQTGGERMGLYFVTSGAGMRATEVVYDRAWSAFAEAPADAWDWDAILAGVDRLHLSGITPALGPVPAESACRAAEAASARAVWTMSGRMSTPTLRSGSSRAVPAVGVGGAPTAPDAMASEAAVTAIVSFLAASSSSEIRTSTRRVLRSTRMASPVLSSAR